MARAEPYADRRDAGRALAGALAAYQGRSDVVVLGLPRGGVPVAAEVAAALGAPLDVVVVRKLGLPGQPELAMGAIAGVGSALAVVRNDEVLDRVAVTEQDFETVRVAEARELRRRERAYRGGREGVSVRGRVALLVDDGLATGSSMRAAVAAVRRQQPATVVIAVPVAAPETYEAMLAEADEVVCPWTPDPFYAVGRFYRDFAQTTDEDVRRALGAGRPVQARAGRAESTVRIPADDVELDADLTIPPGARGVVVFAHGSGSGRRSSRNRHVAHALQRAGYATLLVDLLTTDEERVDRATRELRFDVGLLADRVTAAVDWWSAQASAGELPDVPVATFGASTGAAAALVTAARRTTVAAVVSRGGRPDLADEVLGQVTVPTLLAVGGRDPLVLELNEAAAARLGGSVELVVVPGATHLFAEPGAMDEVVDHVVRVLGEWLG